MTSQPRSINEREDLVRIASLEHLEHLDVCQHVGRRRQRRFGQRNRVDRP